jgi:hypothetical protein
VTEELSQEYIATLNDMSGFFSFKPNFIIKCLGSCDKKIKAVIKGNQAGGTSTVAYDYVRRIMGIHPMDKLNMKPDSPIRVIRFASETLPNESGSGGEVRNTIYPQIKKFLPNSLIMKDITLRRPVMTVRDVQGGLPIQLEFVSYGQEVQSQAGVQRFSIYLDEESPQGFYEEQLPRLIAADGDLLMGVTLTEKLTWMFDEVLERAGVIYNSDTIIKYMNEKYGRELTQVESTGRESNIAIIRAATDDNPTLDIKVINEIMSVYDDESTVESRRYGIPHQASGIIFKDFDAHTHVISRDKYFETGLPQKWVHVRGIDFHEHTNWAILWVALSTQNEVFIYQEYNPSPDRMVTLQIAKQIALRSGEYTFYTNLIDPLSAKKQVNTGLSALDDINNIFREFRHEGLGTGGYWTTWDTKSARGRDEIKARLKNSKLCQRPFNNRLVSPEGRESFLPTLWVCDNCPETIYSFRNWRWDEWASKEAQITKDEKNKPQERHSHFPVTMECLLKHPAFNTARFRQTVLPPRESPYTVSMRSR